MSQFAASQAQPPPCGVRLRAFARALRLPLMTDARYCLPVICTSGTYRTRPTTTTAQVRFPSGSHAASWSGSVPRKSASRHTRRAPGMAPGRAANARHHLRRRTGRGRGRRATPGHRDGAQLENRPGRALARALPRRTYHATLGSVAERRRHHHRRAVVPPGAQGWRRRGCVHRAHTRTARTWRRWGSGAAAGGEGMSMRSITRTVGCSINTVTKLLEDVLTGRLSVGDDSQHG